MVHTCPACERNFTTRKLNIHSASCKAISQKIVYINNQPSLQTVEIQQISQEETSPIVDLNELNIERESFYEPFIPPYVKITTIPSSSIYNVDGINFFEFSNKTYEEITKWKKNLFKLPSWKAAKSFISELSFWLEQFNRETTFQGIAIKVYMILPSLLLQKPSKTSKAKEHLKKLDQRLTIWREGKIGDLLREGIKIQKKLKASNFSVQ